MKKMNVFNIVLVLVWLGLFVVRVFLKQIPTDTFNFIVFTFYTLVIGMIGGMELIEWRDRATKDLKNSENEE